MKELREGLWWWTAPHPDWKPDDAGPTGWNREVSSYAVAAGEGVVLIDPQAPPRELAERAVAVALTCEWHARDAKALGVPIYKPGTEGAPPPGLRPRPTAEDGEIAYWIPDQRALMFGDVVSSDASGLRVNWTWVPYGFDESTIAPALRPLLELPIEVVLPGHGPPVVDDARAALERALER